jgi:hypothetical protein
MKYLLNVYYSVFTSNYDMCYHLLLQKSFRVRNFEIELNFHMMDDGRLVWGICNRGNYTSNTNNYVLDDERFHKNTILRNFVGYYDAADALVRFFCD